MSDLMEREYFLPSLKVKLSKEETQNHYFSVQKRGKKSFSLLNFLILPPFVIKKILLLISFCCFFFEKLM